MDYFYKVEITIDEEKVLADGRNIDKVYEELYNCFYNDFFQKERSGNSVTFGTPDKENCSMMWQRICIAYRSWLKPYFKTMTWHIVPLGITEDILAKWYVDYVYKFEITVDEEKVLADGKDLDKVYEDIDSYFIEDGLQRKQYGALVTYYTMIEELNDPFIGDVLCLYHSDLRPYIKSTQWYNTFMDNLPEDAFKTLAKRGR